MKPAPHRRTTIKIITLLLAGAVINVAVAWGAVYLQLAPVNARHIPVAQDLWTRYCLPEYLNGTAQYENFSGAPGVDFFLLVADLPASDQQQFTAYWPPKMLVVRAGLPMPAVESMNGWGPLPPQSRWGIPIPAHNPNIAWVSLLPFRPLWPGIVINTVFYAGVLWVLFCGPFALRRMIRRRRGQCAHCAYPIGQNERCTECGAEVDRR